MSTGVGAVPTAVGWDRQEAPLEVGRARTGSSTRLFLGFVSSASGSLLPVWGVSLPCLVSGPAPGVYP